MNLYKQASKLSKEIEKLTIVLTDGTALTQAQHTAKENKWAVLIAQLHGFKPTATTSSHHQKLYTRIRLVFIFPGGLLGKAISRLLLYLYSN